VRERHPTHSVNKIMADQLFSPAALMPPSAVRRRLAALVVTHAELNAAQLFRGLLPAGQSTTYIDMALQAISIGSIMTLAFWLGMGGGSFIGRLLVTALAATATNFLMHLPHILRMRTQSTSTGIAYDFEWRELISSAGMLLLFVGLLGGAFLIARIWLILVRPLEPDDRPRRDWLKFSVLHLLMAMSLCALALTLIKVARSNPQVGPGFGLAFFAALAVGIGLYFANTLVAALAALGRKPLAPRIAVTLLVAVALGIAMSVAAGHDEYGWTMMITGVIVMVVATSMIVTSLLVVRSCGYRLVRRPSRTWAAVPTNPLAPEEPPCVNAPSAN
jgi:hypothetical protein